MEKRALNFPESKMKHVKKYEDLLTNDTKLKPGDVIPVNYSFKKYSEEEKVNQRGFRKYEKQCCMIAVNFFKFLIENVL
jgi:hypothetical protein